MDILPHSISPSAGACYAPIQELGGLTKFLDDTKRYPTAKYDAESHNVRTMLWAVRVAKGDIAMREGRRSLQLRSGRNRRSVSLRLYIECDIVGV